MVQVESLASTLAVVIKLPPEAMVPLLIGTGVLLVLLFSGAALASWKARSPGPARVAGTIAGVVLCAAAAYRLLPILTEVNENSHEHTGVYLVTLFDAPIIGFLAALGVVLWGWANQRWLALGIGLAFAVALILKPFLWPLGHYYDGTTYHRSTTDLEHLVFILAGVVVGIAALVVGGRKRVG